MSSMDVLPAKIEGSEWPDEDQDSIITWKHRFNSSITFKQDLWSPVGQNNSYGAVDDLPWLDTEYPDWELPQNAQTVLIILYSVTILLAVTGNLLVIVVLILGNRVKTELTVFLLNLAIADLTMAFFCMPFTFTKVMLGRWIFGAFMCPFASFMQVTSVAVSIFTNMAIGIDRFWGVIYPLKQKLTKTRAKFVLSVIWVSAMALASAQFFVTRSTQQTYDGKKFWDCDEKWQSEEARHSYTLALVSLTYFIPLVVLCFTYYKVGTRLWVRNAPGNAHHSRDQILLRSKRKVIKMVITLVVVFAVCWLPLHLFMLLLDFAPHLAILNSPTDEHIFFGVYYSCHWLAMGNSFVNPIIYSFLNESFRADLRMLFSRIPCIRMRDSSRDLLGRTLSTRASMRTLSSGAAHRSSRRPGSHSARTPARTCEGQANSGFASSKCVYEMQTTGRKATLVENSGSNTSSNNRTVVIKPYDTKLNTSEATTKC